MRNARRLLAAVYLLMVVPLVTQAGTVRFGKITPNPPLGNKANTLKAEGTYTLAGTEKMLFIYVDAYLKNNPQKQKVNGNAKTTGAPGYTWEITFDPIAAATYNPTNVTMFYTDANQMGHFADASNTKDQVVK